MVRRPPRATRTDTLCPLDPLCRAGAMTDPAAPTPQPAGPPKRDPGKLDLRAAPRRVVRFRRGLVIGAAALGSGAILGVTMMALQGPALRIQEIGRAHV